jgi:hypothetical protein
MTYLELPETMGEVRDGLAHFGVKGMRWGERHARKKSARQAARRERNDRIDAARGRVASGQSARERKEAKTKFKTERKAARAAGNRAAKVAAKRDWKIAKEKYNNDVYTAQLTKSGSETAAALLTVVGGAAIGGLRASGGLGRTSTPRSTGFAPSTNRPPIRVQATVGR